MGRGTPCGRKRRIWQQTGRGLGNMIYRSTRASGAALYGFDKAVGRFVTGFAVEKPNYFCQMNIIRIDNFCLCQMPNEISSESICERNDISMSEKYNEYCMKFSNQELKNYMYDIIEKNTNLYLKCLSVNGEETDIKSEVRIETISFDENESLSIMFFGYQTSIFVYDLEIMFIDEDSKGTYTSSDVYNNVVYEGCLREMSHEQMLKMFSEIILCFVDAAGVSMTQQEAADSRYKRYNYYEPHIFTINVQNNHAQKKVNTYENIIITH